MSSSHLRIVAPADDAPRSNDHPLRLESMEALEDLLRSLLEQRVDGEVRVEGQGTARICLYDGKVAWVHTSGHHEYLSDVMRRELGLSRSVLRRAVTHCRASGMRFGEGMVDLGLIEPRELRECLYRHVSDHLVELLSWSGELTVMHGGWPHRYDHTYTFTLDELLSRPARPTAAEQRSLAAVVRWCEGRLPELSVACVIESEEGTVLHGARDDDEAHDMLGLCASGLRRLVANRVTRGDGSPECMMLVLADAMVVVRQLDWRPGWLLVLGGSVAPGPLLSVIERAAGGSSNDTAELSLESTE